MVAPEVEAQDQQHPVLEHGRHQHDGVGVALGELSALLKEIPKVSTIVLTNSDGLPWKTGFGSSWNKALIAAKLNGADLHFHDFRGTAATRMYLAGLSKREIAEATAWDEESVDRIIRRYVTRDALLRERIAKLDQNGRRTETEKSAEKS